MGKAVDAVLALMVLIIGLYVLTKLGITLGTIWAMFSKFFGGPAGSAAGILLFGTASGGRLRRKHEEAKEGNLRLRIASRLTSIPNIFKKRTRGE